MKIFENFVIKIVFENKYWKIKFLNRKFVKFELTQTRRPDIWTQKYNFSLILLSESKVIKIIQLPKGPTWTTRESNLKLILTRTKCANQIFNVLTHYILLTHQYLDPPTPSGDPLGIDTSCQVLFLGIRTAGKVLPAGFQVLSGIGDPWIGRGCWPLHNNNLSYHSA